MTENTNPLNKYFRQPSIYVTLPSGASYPPTVLQQTQSGEIGIQPMTAKDEIRFKTPDALMNGQGVVDVIESCVPQIKDAWQIKSYDLDTLLIAIRIATYGETMDFTFTVPGANEQVTHSQQMSFRNQHSHLKFLKSLLLLWVYLLSPPLLLEAGQ